ncbi:unnamed protein product [Cladocopium goreaui]|uniref:C3H1-type domain-containing protein n=1 Tax=Cladocopium goreaui TaxID=2562237 RepID=A0A9P1GMR7_9DINO|nr:unnamed protein product [Cladocopium goreaui]
MAFMAQVRLWSRVDALRRPPQTMSWVYGDAATSTGSSAATSASELPARRDRTRLSAKARPFRSSSSLASGDDWELGSWQPYNPELQDMVYLNVGMPSTYGPAAASSQDVPSQGPMQMFYSAFFSTSSPSVQGLRERLPSTPGSLQEGPASADMRQYQSPCLKRGLSLDANLPNSDEVPRPHSSSELVVPVKRTFIHYDAEHLQDSPRSDGMRRCQSAPARLLSRQLGRVTEAHKAGTCKPCAYFFAKADGCRWHNSCEFCHLCPPGEIKKRKKQKKAFLRAEASKSQED